MRPTVFICHSKDSSDHALVIASFLAARGFELKRFCIGDNYATVPKRFEILLFLSTDEALDQVGKSESSIRRLVEAATRLGTRVFNVAVSPKLSANRLPPLYLPLAKLFMSETNISERTLSLLAQLIQPAIKPDFDAELEAMRVSKAELTSLVEGVIRTFPEDRRLAFESASVIAAKAFSKSAAITSGGELLRHSTNRESAERSILVRAVLCGYIIDLARREPLGFTNSIDLRSIWPILYPTLSGVSGIPLTASYGSQRFITIPIFLNGTNKNLKELIRLHIWDTSFIDDSRFRTDNPFAIHSHRFYAKSWILKGELVNSFFSIRELEGENEESEFSFFDVVWDDEHNEKADRLRSAVINSGRLVRVTRESTAVIQEGQSYEIDHTAFHSSFFDYERSSQALTASIFIFDATRGHDDRTDVVGPTSIERFSVERDIALDPQGYIEKLNFQLGR